MDDGPPKTASDRLQAAMADYRRARELRWAAGARVNECIRALRKAEARLARAEAYLKAREKRLHTAVMWEPKLLAHPAEEH